MGRRNLTHVKWSNFVVADEKMIQENFYKNFFTMRLRKLQKGNSQDLVKQTVDSRPTYDPD